MDVKTAVEAAEILYYNTAEYGDMTKSEVAYSVGDRLSDLGFSHDIVKKALNHFKKGLQNPE